MILSVRRRVRRCFQKRTVRSQTKRRTTTGQTMFLTSKYKWLSVRNGVSGVCCLTPKVCLSVWGGFLRNPQPDTPDRKQRI